MRDRQGTLTFPSGVVLQAIRVQINDCNVTTKSFFTLTLSAATNATLDQTTTQVDVRGGQNLQPTPGLYVRDAVVDTTAGAAQVAVLLGGPNGATSASTVSVNYTTTNGSAVAGTDYTTTSGTLTFGPGQTEQNISVPIIDRTTRCGFPELLGDAVEPGQRRDHRRHRGGHHRSQWRNPVSSPFVSAPPEHGRR